jgi:Carboxypeptidase regulatory-like domain
MHKSRLFPLTLSLAMAALLPALVVAQSFNGSIAGTVRDPAGAVVASAEMVLKNMATGVEIKRSSDERGEYAFRNLVPGSYDLRVTGPGFQPYVQKAIEVSVNRDVRQDINLTLGSQTEEIEVMAETTTLNYNNAAHEDGIAPDTLAQLPLQFQTGPRSSAGFAVLMPGISTGGTANAFDARINGGMQSGDEAVLDGASMQQGFMSQSGMVSIFQDFPFSPDMVSEIKVVTTSYEPHYGSSTSGQIVATTKSGGDSFHGAAFEYHQNDGLNATQWGAASKGELSKHNYGGNVGGPMKIPGLWSNSVKTYFYVNYEGYRQTGGATRNTYSIPSLQERNGDFSDWRDANGNLIPIFDPATIRVLPNGDVVKDPFPGNIIPANRITPQARQFMQFLPQPTSGGPLNNYLEPTAVPDTILGDSDYYFGRFDSYIGQKDHIAFSVWHQRAPAKFFSHLPQEISFDEYSDPQNSWVNRINWDHTFGPNLLNHVSFGYLNRNEGYGSINQDFVDELPQIAGVAGHNVPPRMEFSDDFAAWGNASGVNVGNITTRPTYVLNDLLTWIKKDHTIKIGFEYRNIGGNLHSNGNQAGTFRFGRGATGLLELNSGSPIASFLLGAVDNADSTFRDVDSTYPRQAAWIAHVGDTWRVNEKLTVNYGLRWDYFTSSREKFNRFSFFDPTGANPGAGGRPGRLAFAGTEWGEASYGADYPEKPYKKAFAPRLGVTYALNSKTIVRAGWGIFYDRAFYPDWAGGIRQDGFSSTIPFNSSLGGLQPAFLLQDGFPQTFVPPPFIQSDYRNGQDVLYRPLDANERPRSQQWNLTVDREISRGFSVGLAYVGSRGSRLPSNNRPLNALDPSLLSLGNALYDEFQEGQTSLHGVPEPYPGWRNQLTLAGCAPSLAQALLPYPQYCSPLQGLNENHGTSIYHSLQAKLEKRLSGGTYALVSYTFGKIITSGTDNIQRTAVTWSGVSGIISPFEEDRNRSLAVDDVAHILSAAFVYELPFGKGRKYVDKGGITNALLGGWQFSTVFRYSSGVPFFFRSSFCNVPSQFRAGCIPALRAGADPFAQDMGSFDPGKGPLFNKDAFEPVESFNFNYGTGPRVSSIRGASYRNQDITFVKNTALGKGLNLQLRIEAFNVWNWHNFTTSNERGAQGGQIVVTDIASPDFGRWTGQVTSPRVIQVAARLEF